MLVFSLILVGTVMASSCDVVLSSEKGFRELKSLHKKVDQLESFVRQQAMLNQKQAEQLAQQDILIRQQARTFSQKTEELVYLSQQVTEQKDQLSQQSDQLHKQNILIAQLQSSFFKLVSSTLQQADTGMTAPKDTSVPHSPIDRLFGDETEQGMTPRKNLESAEKVQEEYRMSESGKAATFRKNPYSLLRHVSSRSDDYGSLQVQLTQMGQHLSEVDALIQGLKNTDTQHSSHIQAMESHNQQQDTVIQDARSSTFVRWGSSLCPNHTQLVYSGVVGGSWHVHTGAAVNRLCLTMSPVFSDDRNGGARLYGGSYETSNLLVERKPVCAACRSSFSTNIMIPGTNVCTSGWTPLYAGYLMAGGYTHSAGSEYLCVDAALESSPDTAFTEDGAMFFFTQTRCGSLPCTPYVNNKTVSCVLCGQ